MTRANLVDGLMGLFGVMCAVAGAVMAVGRDEPGLSALFIVVAVVVLSLALRLRQASRSVPLRPDLHAWLETMAVVAGESSADVANRAISSFRAGLDE